MFDNQFQEHLAHSAPCASRWDGFDRGDTGIASTTRECVGRMTNGAGQRVAIWLEVTHDGWGDSFGEYVVTVDGDRVASSDDKPRAVRIARWWMAGCPA